MVSFKRPANYSRTTKGFAFYDDPEELYAVLVQGIYASERKNPVRSSHTGHYPIDKQLDGSLEFYKTGTQSFDLVRRFCMENPGFTREIAGIETHFNPIRAYYFTPAAAKQMAQSKFATNSNIDFEQSRKVQIPTATDFFQSPNMFGCGTRQDQSGYTIWRTTLKAGRQELAGNST
jgi:hypothetical protein